MAINGHFDKRQWHTCHMDDTDASFVLCGLRLRQQLRPWFQLERYCVLARGGPLGDTTVEASVKLRVDGAVRHVVREGNGAVHALDLALREALRFAHPRLEEMALVDYSAHALDNDGDSTGGVHVQLRVWDRVHDRNWSAAAMAGDVVCATVRALVDAFEFKRWVDVNDPAALARQAEVNAVV